VGRNATNEPTGPVLMAMAGLGVPALVCALLILLATGLPAAFAGPVAVPIGRPSMTAAARAGLAVRVGPFPRRRFLVDVAGQDGGSPGSLPRRIATAHVLPARLLAREGRLGDNIDGVGRRIRSGSRGGR
jgi:hypothetical protein